MKFPRFAFALAVTALTTTPVWAASVTMLQFGSFETRAEAEKRLGEIKSKHGSQLGSLTTSVREIKLPPDNLTVYRTQAGPLADRSAAQTICSKLASAGDECYIVQTAMVVPAEAPVSVAETKPVPAAAIAPLAEMPALAATPAPDVTSQLTTTQTLPERDPASRAALSNISTAPAVATLADSTPAPANEASPELRAALDKAAAEQDATAKMVDETTAAAEPKRAGRSFWSRLNPFSDGDEPKAPANVAKTQEVVAAPVEAVASAPIAPAIEQPVATLTPAAVPVAEQAPAPVTIAAPEVTTPVLAPVQVPAPAPAPITAEAPIVMQAGAMTLPPPPAPLKARDREELLTAQQRELSKPESLGAPIEVKPLPPVNGQVQVEEAKRVPVTAASGIAPLPGVSQQQAPVSLQPSSTAGQRTVWAQIGPFATNDAALSFWANYRQANPDFPVVRVRAASPLQQQAKAKTKQQAWLRIGPVTQPGFVRNLCASIAPNSGLRCGSVADIGTAAALSPTKSLSKAVKPASRYYRQR